jgi:hypothetical protein
MVVIGKGGYSMKTEARKKRRWITERKFPRLWRNEAARAVLPESGCDGAHQRLVLNALAQENIRLKSFCHTRPSVWA